MSDNYDVLDEELSNELFDMFKDQFEQQLPDMEAYIVALSKQDQYSEAVDNLFRMMHNYKATVGYLSIKSMISLVKRAEELLGTLRTQTGPADESVIDWLLRTKDHFNIWLDEMDLGLREFTKVDLKFVNEIKITASKIRPADRIKELNLLYIDANETRAVKFTGVLKNTLNDAYSVTSLNALESMGSEYIPEICLINMGNENLKAIDIIHEKFTSSAIIVVHDKMNRAKLMKVGLKGVNHNLVNPIKGSDLKRELLAVTESHFSERRLLISNKKINDFIEDLQPLPSSIFQVQQICDDEDMSVRDLIKVVKVDPIISASILNAAASPIYGLKSVSTIDNAVSIFGKRTVKAIVLSEMSSNLGDIDLDAYGINEATFSEIAAKRLSLMIKWYSKISIADLSILSSSAILGSLGQLLIAKEVKNKDFQIQFLEYINEYGAQAAEEQFMHTTTPFVTSDILQFWNLPRDIIESIKYSDNPEDAPDEVRSLAIANHIVYRLIGLDAKVKSEINDDILMILQNEGLDPAHLERALKSLG